MALPFFITSFAFSELHKVDLKLRSKLVVTPSFLAVFREVIASAAALSEIAVVMPVVWNHFCLD